MGRSPVRQTIRLWQAVSTRNFAAPDWNMLKDDIKFNSFGDALPLINSTLSADAKASFNFPITPSTFGQIDVGITGVTFDRIKGVNATAGLFVDKVFGSNPSRRLLHGGIWGSYNQVRNPIDNQFHKINSAEFGIGIGGVLYPFPQ